MNILCVCGNGIGTSVLLKVNVESVAADLGVDVNVPPPMRAAPRAPPT